nr:hypothetical protein [Tanacetum cinerariifolium]
METEVESMVIVLIHQASSSAHPLSTPVVSLSPPKPVPSTTQAPIFLATTTTETITTLPPPPQHQSASVLDLASRVLVLEQVCSNFKKRHTLQDKIVQGISSRVFTLKRKDLPHKINQIVNDVVKEAIFESGSYKSLLERVALYKDLEASIECANRDEFLAEIDKSRKRRCDNQDPPPPPPDSDLNKKKRHDSDASGSKQPPAP